MSQPNFNLSTEADGQVECLGEMFASDEARREHYLKLLAQKLKDPAFRKIEGFPIGKDEDILALSDPPYFTACPNPWLGKFIKCYGTTYDSKKPYHREPFATDVSEGKTHPIYTAHGYHTKVPHRAIMRYILHYTEPDEVVFDGFAGTGMAGIAAQLCGDQREVKELGYRVEGKNSIISEDGKSISKLGPRRSILNDLAPAATFIAQNYLLPLDAESFESEARKLLKETEKDCGWMYETMHKDGKSVGRINFTVWSDIFSCPECAGEINFVKEAFDEKTQSIRDTVKCPHCAALLSKSQLELRYESHLDPTIGTAIRIPIRVPVRINYSVGGNKYEKVPDKEDLALLKRIAQQKLPSEVPSMKLPEMQMARVGRMQTVAISHLHHFFLPRQAHALATLWRKAKAVTNARLRNSMLFFVEQAIWGLSLLNRYSPSHFSQVNRALSGVFYVASQISEVSPWYNLDGKLGRLSKTFPLLPQTPNSAIITTQDCGAMPLVDNSVDYIFTDPPFGENIYYSDLNMLVEAWHGVLTNSTKEAIVDRVKNKSLSDYQGLMQRCFREYFRILKPGRWITVEFSNSQASVWNAIQTTLQEVGFVVATVAALDKQQHSFQSVTSPTAVKQDLVISAYKPNGGLEERFDKAGGTEAGIWEFIKTHLKNLPIVKAKGGLLEFIPERDPRILYDRMVAFYVRHETPVPLSSAEFQASLTEKFPERDSMFFLPEQVNEYDKKRAQVENIGQLTIFVEDERSAINWLRNFLKDRPSVYSDIQPDFMQQLGASWKKWETRPELKALLDQNFLCYENGGDVPSQIHSYLSSQFKELRNLSKDHAQLKAKAKNRWYVPDPKKNVDVETLRNKRLLEEFWSYLPEGYTPPVLTANKGQALPGATMSRPKIPKGKKLKELRTEAVRVGFKHCYQQKDYTTILVVAEMIPESVLNEDEQLQMIYDTAVTRSGAAE
jgi:16S rRNA G966 N2-methylase RsmD